MKYADLNANIAARITVDQAMFDAWPEAVQQAMVTMAEQVERDAPLAEEQRQRQAYLEQQRRATEVTRQQMREAGFVERIGLSSRVPYTRLNRIEMGHNDISCEFPSNEPDPVIYLGGRIIGFRRRTIDGMVPQMQQIWDQANAVQNVQRSVTGYILFHIWTGAQRRLGTRAISLTGDWARDIDDLYEALALLIADIDKVKAGYEFIFEGDMVSYLHFNYRVNYYPEPKCVTNWGTNVKAVERRGSFDIFTASNDGDDCVLQVAKRIWGSDATECTVDQIVNRAERKVCILKPYSHIRDIRSLNRYSDLTVELRSPVKTFNVIDSDVIYLLHFNEHVGLLENMKEAKRAIQYTSFRPLVKFSNVDKITMCFDIECYFDPRGSNRHVPYLCCACFVYDDSLGNIMEFEGPDCVAQMLDYAADAVKEVQLKQIELVAHNGGSYDFHYLLTSMYDPGVIKNLMLRNNRFISFDFKHSDVKFSVKDSFNFMGFSLQKAAKSFLGEDDRKTDFPHHEMRTEEDLCRVFQEWISVDREISVNVEKDKMIVSYQDVVQFKQDGQSKALLDWCKIYCVNDVMVLAKVWTKFKKTVYDVFNCHIVDQTYTLAGLSFRLFEAHLPVTLLTHTGHGMIRLEHPIKRDFVNMRKALVGGRCISLNGFYKHVVCLDVKSLYPAAMAYYDQPYGHYRLVTEEVPGELGIYYCEVHPVSVDGHGFFPLRQNDKAIYGGELLPYRAWYTSVDINIGREEGHKINVCVFDGKYVGYSWKHKGKIFRDYIKDVLYHLKLVYEQESDSEKRYVIKIIMNSLWGKFAQKWCDDSYSIQEEGNMSEDTGEWYKIFDTEWFIVKQQKNKAVSSKPLQNGIFTLSWARHHMFLVWKRIAKEGQACIYSDTDSIMIPMNSINKEATFELDGQIVPVLGDNMGQLEVEHIFDELICVGKKQYIGKYGPKENPSYKKRFKGVPQQYIVPQMYAHLLKNVNNMVEVQFLKFKREWGCVSGYIESKTLKQT